MIIVCFQLDPLRCFQVKIITFQKLKIWNQVNGYLLLLAFASLPLMFNEIYRKSTNGILMSAELTFTSSILSDLDVGTHPGYPYFIPRGTLNSSSRYKRPCFEVSNHEILQRPGRRFTRIFPTLRCSKSYILLFRIMWFKYSVLRVSTV